MILINDAYSRWSTGNRGRATSASEVIEVAGSNHAIGVILNLAWGPNNFSPEYDLELADKEQLSNWLGGRVTPPRGIHFLIFDVFSSCLSFLIFFSFCEQLSFRAINYFSVIWFWYVYIAFPPSSSFHFLEIRCNIQM